VKPAARMKGHLITFEGIDFSGKSLQANLLKENLQKKGRPVIFLREPGGTEISEKIRGLLLDTENQKMTAATELLLYSAARAQIVNECVIPHLKSGDEVICDRFYHSTTAYQGFGRQLDLQFIEQLNAFATNHVVPDLTFLIDLKPETALRRKKNEKGMLDRLEQESLAFHHRVRQGYLELAHQEGDRFVVVDGEQPVDSIQQLILDTAQSRLHLY